MEAGLSENDFTERLSRARAIADPDDREFELAEVARAQAHAGLFQEALETARRDVSPDYLASILAEISEAQAEAGLLREAVETAREIDSPSWSADALLNVVSKQAAAGSRHEALGTARAIDVGHLRAIALVRVGRAQVEAGDDPSPLIGEVLDFVRAHAATSVEEGRVMERELSQVAAALAECGFLAQSLEIARSLQTSYERAGAFADILEYQADDGLFEEGMRAASDVRHPEERAVALLGLARHAPNEESLERAFSGALEAIRTIGDPARRGWGESKIALAQARAGQRLDALATASSIDVFPMRSRALEELEKQGIDREEMAPGSFKIFDLDDPTFRVIYVPVGPLGEVELMQKGGRPGLTDIFLGYVQEGTELEVTRGAPRIRAGWDPNGAYAALMQAFRDFGLKPEAIGSVPEFDCR
jgi:hypothetical protein